MDNKLKTVSPCPQPYSGIILNQNGGVSVCRMLAMSETVGNIKDNTLEEIWNGEKIVAWRKDFFNSIPERCKKSIKEFNCHLTSPGYKALNVIDYKEVMSEGPQRITFNYTGACNLLCPMCETKVLGRGPYPKDLLSIIPSHWFSGFQYIDFYGGEPMIHEETYEIIEGINKKSKDILWSFTTNGNWDFEEIIQRISHLKIFSIHFSIDTMDEEKHSFLRKGGDLSLLLGNIDKMLSFRSREYAFDNDFNIEASLTVQIENWNEIYSFVDWVKSKGMIPLIQSLDRPVDRSIYSLPLSEKLRIIEYCYGGLKKYYPHINPILRSVLKSLPSEEYSIKWIEYLSEVEQIFSKDR